VAEQPVKDFGALLRQLRSEADLTQEELAHAANLSTRSISDLERGINLTARRDTARLLADALGLNGARRVGFEAAARGRRPETGYVRDWPPPDGGAVATATRTLPRDAVGFTGREEELGRLIEAVNAQAGPGGVIAIHAIDGMAGVGKTTFAVHVAHLLANRFRDGQIFLELHAHAAGHRPVEPADALSSLLLATGVAAEQIPPGLRARTMLWRNHMADKQMLLLLDDASGHEQVRPLLPGAPATLVLITSRRHLTALDDAATVSLDSLPAADARKLFVRLAARQDVLADEAAVAEIVRLCGFLPLAVGMLARRLHHHPNWTADGLARELEDARDRLSLMYAENLSVAAAFDLSYQDLSAEQQRLFRRLGLHPGTEIDSATAAILADVSQPVATRMLDDLYDQHLISEPARDRYRLHDLIREYARALASTDDPDDNEAAIGRLLDYYSQRTERAGQHFGRGQGARDRPLRPADQDELRRDAHWLEAERANLQAAVECARLRGSHAHCMVIPAAIHGFLRTRGHWGQALTLHEVELASSRTVGDRACEARALTCVGTVQRLIGNYVAATAALEEALRISRELGDLHGQGQVLQCLGVIQRLTVGYSTAAATLEEALGLYQLAEDPLGQADALNELGFVQRLAGLATAAIASHRAALELNRGLDDPGGQADSLRYLGLALQESGDYREIISIYERALELYRAIEDRLGQAHALSFLGVAQHLTSDYGSAPGTLSEALALYEALGHRLGQAEVRNNLGDLQWVSDPAQARANYEWALEMALGITALLEEARALEGIGSLDFAVGDAERGADRLRDALGVYQKIGHPHAARVAATLRHYEL
jgi:tetratricopeptide (TPR) repeat protein/transcriptional regulator with XRE-family HTH domain